MGGSWVCGLWGFGEGGSVVWSGDGKGFRGLWGCLWEFGLRCGVNCREIGMMDYFRMGVLVLGCCD